MKYIDSGDRNPSQALGTWLNAINPLAVAELRFQSGFFGAAAIALLLPLLTELRVNGGTVRALIGSNDEGTVGDDVTALVNALGIPRDGAELGICAFGNGFFHPKVIHIRQYDGEQAAYVGSANLTARGVSGLHVEAGVLLNTEEGDSANELDRIAQAVDAWFSLPRPGFFRVGSPTDVESLVAAGVLCKRSNPTENQPPSRKSWTGQTLELPVLKTLIQMPAFGVHFDSIEDTDLVPSGNESVSSLFEKGDLLDKIFMMDLSKNRPARNSYQADLGQHAFLKFFGGKVGERVPIELTQVRSNGIRVLEKERHVFAVKSINFRVEIGAFAGLDYPDGPKRPIVTFHRAGEASFDYILTLPGEPGYDSLDGLLRKLAPSTRPGGLRRAMLSTSDLNAAWPGNPLV